MAVKHIAIFASGNGSNAENITNYFAGNSKVTVSLMLTNNPNAGVIERANRLNIPCLIFDRNKLTQTNYVLDILKEKSIDFIVLAGFLWKVPDSIITAYADNIINIHPALLPKYGGKGMYGDKVHAAVKENGDTETGISIHYVNERYDEGQIIFQKTCKIDTNIDSIDDIAQKVHELEYAHFPKVIEQLLLSNKSL